MYTKDEVKEKLQIYVCILTISNRKYSEEDCRDDYFKLKELDWNEIMVEGKNGFKGNTESKYPLTYEGNPLFQNIM